MITQFSSNTLPTPTNQQLIIDALVDLGLRIALPPLVNVRFGVVASAPRAVEEGYSG